MSQSIASELFNEFFDGGFWIINFGVPGQGNISWFFRIGKQRIKISFQRNQRSQNQIFPQIFNIKHPKK